MRDLLRRFGHDRRASVFTRVALGVAVVGGGAVMAANMLDYTTNRHAPEMGAVARDVARLFVPGESDVDMTPTASIRDPHVVLNPCTGARE